MAQSIMKTHILICNDTSAKWADSDKVLLKGEVGIEFIDSETAKMKIGNGDDIFADLPYAALTPVEVNQLIQISYDKILGGVESEFDTLKKLADEVKTKSDKGHKHTKGDITDFPKSLPASDVSDWAKAGTKPSYTAVEVGAIPVEEKGRANGVADLDSNGQIPSFQLPSYAKLGLGTSSSSAFRGDYGNSAYQHSLSPHAPTNAERNAIVGVQKNGQDLPIDSSRKVNISVPTKLSELENDTGFSSGDDSPGTPGPPGADGKAATIEVAETITGEPGTSAKVENIGTLNAAKLKFTIPRGKDGASGSGGGGSVEWQEINNTDLDTVQEPGCYYNGGEGGKLCTNTPSGVQHFGMVVIHSAISHRTQILTNQNNWYSREYKAGSWDAWKQIDSSATGSGGGSSGGGTSITGAASTIVSANLDSNKALISNGDGKVAVSNITSTELGYLSGVKSNIQTQMASKLDTEFQSRGYVGMDEVTLVLDEVQDVTMPTNNNQHQVNANYHCAAIGGTSNKIQTDNTNVVSSVACGGTGNTIKGDYSFIGGGQRNVVSGRYATAIGGNNNEIVGDYACSLQGNNNTVQSYQIKMGHYAKDGNYGNSEGTTGDALIIGNGGYSAQSNAFRVTYEGKVYGTGQFNTTGADYAEFFEWLDGNPENVDRRGLFVTLDGDKIRIANADDDYILGAISSAPGVVGNNYADSWRNMWMTDVFGKVLTHRVHHDAEYNDIEIKTPREVIDKETGETTIEYDITTERVLIHEAYDSDDPIINPDYNPDEEYIPREERPEWGIVGMMGQLVVIDDGTCAVNGYCKVADGGIATANDNGYRVIARLDETHIKVLFR